MDSMAGATVCAYRREWHGFQAWCSEHGYQDLPASPDTINRYLTDQAEAFSMSTLYRKIAAIACAHSLSDINSPTHAPTVVRTLRRLRASKAGQRVGKASLMSDDIRILVDILPVNLLGERDRCLILLGFTTGLLRSDLVRLDCESINDSGDSLVITGIRKQAAGPEGALVVPLADDPAICPVRAYRAWLAASGISDGPVFRWVTRHGQVRKERLSDKSVALVVKRAASAAGRDPQVYSSRSLRPGRRSSGLSPETPRPASLL